MENKRRVSVLIPYKNQDGRILVYLQKRAKNAKRSPDYFGFFGGGIQDDESPEDALVREIKEELRYSIHGHNFLGMYESPNAILHVFILPVDNDFENKIEIHEGEYGKFFSEREAIDEPKLSETDKMILRDFFKDFMGRD